MRRAATLAAIPTRRFLLHSPPIVPSSSPQCLLLPLLFRPPPLLDCSLIKTLLLSLHHFSSSPSPTTLETKSSATTTVIEDDATSTRGGGGEDSSEAVVPMDAVVVFQQWGCSDKEVAKILSRQPSIARMDLLSLQSKLEILRGIGLCGPDLVRIITCRPRFLAGRIGEGLDARLDYLKTLFQSKAELLRAISRNPSLLSCDVERTMKPCVELYATVGISQHELGRLLVSRPTIISRTSLDDEKLEFIRRTRLSRKATMYKYVVSIIAVSHLETIREKVANLEKFGFTMDEVLRLVGRSPNLITLSAEKVQRNMIYIIGTMKLPGRIVFEQPFLLFANLEKVLKPRFLLGGKLQEMGLSPQVKGPLLLRALRMKETRFLKAFVNCHEKDVANVLKEYYNDVKGTSRLAAASKSIVRKGFPF